MQENRTRNSESWKYSACCGLGHRFIKWGFGFFIFGLIFGFGVLIHYLVGSRYQNSNYFLSNITLWFGSPLSLSVSYLQIGGLAMALIGAICVGLSHTHETETGTAAEACATTHKHSVALWLCVIGLIALFITGYIGYFVINAIWPAFYYMPIPAGKNLWLILQGLSILCFLIGVIIAVSYLCCCCKGKDKWERRP